MQDSTARTLSPRLRARIERLVGRRVERAEFVDRGYTKAGRWVVSLEDGVRLFAKAATDTLTSDWLREEHEQYLAIKRDFMPARLGWDPGSGADERPLLLLEDLSEAEWPPPWDAPGIRRVLTMLDDVAATPAPWRLASLEERRDELCGWKRVALAPAPFLSLGLASDRWLGASLPRLLGASDNARLGGRALVHYDVRSDNICFNGSRTLLVDWNWACRGHPRFDLAALAPTITAEGGPLPEDLLPDGGDYAALLSGFWASLAGLHQPDRGPAVRELRLRLLRVALPWAVRELGLAPLDGANAPTSA